MSYPQKWPARGWRKSAKRQPLDFAGFTPEVNIAIFPPQIAVYVVHDGNGDLCEAYPREFVELDITSLLGAFGSEFTVTIAPIGSNSDDIVLHHDS